eukprot:TRINITY_DN470_c0_g1_i2.p1 TRINITY_DN470_c0_g1~~TRINITY_DN470_c0_g1_i2.p1  ORF type:complete len:486 (+),score=101.57 TRINITY_DN470_c0_g1_i2:145-1602(+)
MKTLARICVFLIAFFAIGSLAAPCCDAYAVDSLHNLGKRTIQSLVNAHPGGVVCVAPGNYIIKTTIQISNAVTLIGSNNYIDPRPNPGTCPQERRIAESVLKADATLNGPIFSLNSNSIEINGFKFLPAAGCPFAQPVISNTGGPRVSNSIHYNTFTNSCASAISFNNVDSSSISYNWISDPAQLGISSQNGDNLEIFRNEIFSSGSAIASIYVFSGTSNNIHLNTIRSSAAAGIVLGAVTGAGNLINSGSVITANIVLNSSTDGIAVRTSSVEVLDNVVEFSGGEGAISIYGSQNSVSIQRNLLTLNSLGANTAGVRIGVSTGTDTFTGLSVNRNCFINNDREITYFTSNAIPLDATNNFYFNTPERTNTNAVINVTPRLATCGINIDETHPTSKICDNDGGGVCDPQVCDTIFGVCLEPGCHCEDCPNAPGLNTFVCVKNGTSFTKTTIATQDLAAHLIANPSNFVTGTVPGYDCLCNRGPSK